MLKLKNSTACFKTSAGRRGGRPSAGPAALPSDRAAVTGRRRHHSPTCRHRGSLTGQGSAPGRAGAPGQCREAARPPLPGQGGASSHLEEPGEPLLGTFPGSGKRGPWLRSQRRDAGRPLGRLRLRARPGRAGVAREDREGQSMDTLPSALSSAGRRDVPKPLSSVGPWPQVPVFPGGGSAALVGLRRRRGPGRGSAALPRALSEGTPHRNHNE